MHFGFALELSNTDLWYIDLLDIHVDSDIPSKNFPCLHNVFKTSSRQVFKTSTRHVIITSSRRLQEMSSKHLEDVSSVTIFCLPRLLEDILKTSSRLLQDVFNTSLQDVSRHLCKTSSRRLERRKIVTLETFWIRLQDQEMFAGIECFLENVKCRDFSKFSCKSSKRY